MPPRQRPAAISAVSRDAVLADIDTELTVLRQLLELGIHIYGAACVMSDDCREDGTRYFQELTKVTRNILRFTKFRVPSQLPMNLGKTIRQQSFRLYPNSYGGRLAFFNRCFERWTELRDGLQRLTDCRLEQLDLEFLKLNILAKTSKARSALSVAKAVSSSL